MTKEAQLFTYFKEHLLSTEYAPLLIRVTNALIRHGVLTMDALCELPDAKLIRVRNLGAKCFEAAVLMRGMYIAETTQRGQGREA